MDLLSPPRHTKLPSDFIVSDTTSHKLGSLLDELAIQTSHEINGTGSSEGKVSLRSKVFDVKAFSYPLI